MSLFSNSFPPRLDSGTKILLSFENVSSTIENNKNQVITCNKWNNHTKKYQQPKTFPTNRIGYINRTTATPLCSIKTQKSILQRGH